MTVNVNQQRCVTCGKCVKDCPTNTLEMKDGVPSARDGKGDGGLRCQHCLAVCPEAALTLDGVESESLVPLNEMPIPPPNEVANLIRSRLTTSAALIVRRRRRSSTNKRMSRMKKVLLLLLATLAIGGAAAMTVEEAKAFMTASRTRFLSAKSYHIEYTTTAMGIPTESRCWIRRDAKKGVSVLNESQTKPFGLPMPKMTQLVMDGNVYLLSALAPNKALHLKYVDPSDLSDVFCNFFTENGTVEPVSDTKDKCVIKFTPSAAELLNMQTQAKANGGLISTAVLPASFKYTFLKPSKDISEIVGYNAKGEEALKVVVSKLELNAKVDDAYFALPKNCKVVDLKSAAEAAKILGAGLLPKK